MARTHSRTIVAAAALSILVLGLLILVAVKPSEAFNEPCADGGGWSGSGCDSFDAYPWMGYCQDFPDQFCYECEYNCYDGTQAHCGENQTGSVKLCTRCESVCEPFDEH